MVRVTSELALPRSLTLYYTTDVLLSNLPVLVFHGPSTTTNLTQNSSRIQLHIFTAAGFLSFPRIIVSPNSPCYSSINYLPRDKQGDEVCRGLAYGLLRYFRELSEVAKSTLVLQTASAKGKRPGSAPSLFKEQHAADLASSMVKVDNASQVVGDLEAALRTQFIGHVDVDLVLPPGSISTIQEQHTGVKDDLEPDADLLDLSLNQYGSYAPLVKLFGEEGFLPTSRLRRAPSKPTTINRTRSFLKDQKESLRREMRELVETEERYVQKLHDLVNTTAKEFRQKSTSRTMGSASPSTLDLQRLFPQSLDKILELNASFLELIKTVVEESEDDARRDLDSSSASSTGSRYGGVGRLKDPTGALAFAKILLEWLPRFAGPYEAYIHASQNFPQIITGFMKQPSSFSQRVNQTGEQRLRSIVIEPVQRLPRYSLYLDNIINCLPATHPALQLMLKAKDIITEICSMDSLATDKSDIADRLRHLVDAWPGSFYPRGRLITAVDFVEMMPPFHVNAATIANSAREGMLLLFAGCIVILRKVKDCSLSARGLMAEIDKPSVATMMAPVQAAAGGHRHALELGFGGWHALGDTRFTMSEDGGSIWMASSHDLKDAFSGRDRSQVATVRSLVLQTNYDGKALRLTEEIAKARIEGRFSEAERELDIWRLRQIKTAIGLDIHTAVFAEGIDTLVEGRKEPCPIRVVLDHMKGTKGAPIGHYGVEIVANITTLVAGAKYRMEILGLNGEVSVDEVVTEHFLPIFAKRVADLLYAQYQMSNPSLASPLLHFYSKILKSLQVTGEADKRFRPSSPVKLISNFLNAGFGSSVSAHNTSGSISSRGSRTLQLGSVPSMAPPMTRSNSNKSTHSNHEAEIRCTTRTVEESRPANPLVRLEETFTAYVAALQSRKGNILARSFRNRGAADELAINALYNAFIEKPFDTRTSLESTVDVLFSAFEKFLRLGWQDQMGQVMSINILDALQENALRMHPGDFVDYVRMIFSEMAPQNRRAFIAIVKLLADLLDGCGNDGDRGALTAAFAELLVLDGQPHTYINLLDRLVAESERLFEDIGPGAAVGFRVSQGSVNSRSNQSAPGSLTSKGSSLRSRFDTLLRQNSKTEEVRSSVWRSLSKTGRNVATGDPSPSHSKGTLGRSRSIESSQRRHALRDRPTVMGAFDERPSSSHGTGSRLSTIGASPPPEEKEQEKEKTMKKKRRSSLSDLKAMMIAASLEISPGMSPPVDKRPLPVLKFNTSPHTPSPTKIPTISGIVDRKRSSILAASPSIKENSTCISPRNIGSLTERPHNIMSTPDSVASRDVLSHKSHRKSVSLASNIPTLRNNAHGRTSTTAISRPSSSHTRNTSPQKFRLQSPQKLRERLQTEAKVMGEAEASLQSELSKIGEEMARLTGSSSLNRTTTTEIAVLRNSLNSIETRLPNLMADLTARNEVIKLDLETSFQASEEKLRGLDQMYKEVSAENELLYERFNGELAKIVKALKGKGREDREELVKQLKETSEKEASARKEISRLKREAISLRGMLKGKVSAE